MTKVFRRSLTGILSALVLVACTAPTGETDSFVRADRARGGVYSFSLPLTDSLATYDFWFYSRLLSDRQDDIELRVLWLSPSGESFRETVYMRNPGTKGSRELYRSGVGLSEVGEWKINVRPVGVGKEFTGLGLICRENDGTR